MPNKITLQDITTIYNPESSFTPLWKKWRCFRERGVFPTDAGVCEVVRGALKKLEQIHTPGGEKIPAVTNFSSQQALNVYKETVKRKLRYLATHSHLGEMNDCHWQNAKTIVDEYETSRCLFAATQKAVLDGFCNDLRILCGQEKPRLLRIKNLRACLVPLMSDEELTILADHIEKSKSTWYDKVQHSGYSLKVRVPLPNRNVHILVAADKELYILLGKISQDRFNPGGYKTGQRGIQYSSGKIMAITRSLVTAGNYDVVQQEINWRGRLQYPPLANLPGIPKTYGSLTYCSSSPTPEMVGG